MFQIGELVTLRKGVIVSTETTDLYIIIDLNPVNADNLSEPAVGVRNIQSGLRWCLMESDLESPEHDKKTTPEKLTHYLSLYDAVEIIKKEK